MLMQGQPKKVKVFNPKKAHIQLNAFVDSLKNYASALNLSDIINNNIIKIDSIMKKEHQYEPFSKTIRFLKAPRK
ncbi:MAG: hypothetical protein Q8933_17215 [Bacteroidota bacterium]|nr:hypothetical protein [Bacteroidota bacterium]